ncbi:MAG TPA: glycosyltransferase family 9 protein [Syntrophales bacterium]|mgnify:FL=1|nr:glycosyltransferase family 9 protein [Syntrophales bacterium]
MKILVIRTHRLGDVLQLTPMLEGIGKTHPDAKITFLTSEDLTDLLRGHPRVDEIVPFAEKRYRRLLKAGPEAQTAVRHEIYEIAERLQAERFDMVINRQYEAGGILAHLCGAPETRGGSYAPGRGHFFADGPSAELFSAVRADRRRNRRNLADWSLRIAGAPPGSGRMYLHVPPPDVREGDRLLASVRGALPPVAVQLGAARSFRCWGTDNFLGAIRHLADSRGRPVVLLGSPDERELAERILTGCGSLSGRIVDLVGRTSLKTLGAVLRRCEVLISGDTGTAHMAAAVGTPVIGLFFGTAYPWETAPYGTGNFVLFADLPCAPCLDPSSCRNGQGCRKAIRPEHVCRAWDIRESLSRGGGCAGRWDDRIVRLLVSRVDDGAEMTLNDFNAVGTDDPALLFPSRENRALRRTDGPAGDFRLLEENESRLRESLCLHERSWEDAFAGYLEVWRQLLAPGGPVEGSSDGARIVMNALPQLFEQASSALSAGDPVALADLVRSGFRPLREALENGIGRPSIP